MSDTPVPVESTPASAESTPTVVPVDPVRNVAVAERAAPDPTRYGDWEKNGRCIDF